MKAPLLHTKLHLPSVRSRLVSRERLTERSGKGRHNKLTLICAPAGFGKSTLASHWLAQQDDPVAWVSLDERDNDPIRFFTYLFSALQKADPDLGGSGLQALRSPNPPGYETLATYLINDLVSAESYYFLALDDFDLIYAQEIHDALSFLLENLPPNLHVVLISRVQPALPLAKLRARNQLVELGPADLRFTREETEAFLSRVMGLGQLTAEEIAELARQTEGWITGLQLIALSLRDTPPGAARVQQVRGSDRYVADYLFEEVFSRHAPSLQAFLLQTSILERLSDSLCNAVAELEDSQSVLEHLERANLFVVSLDNKREWYRYHQLFAEWLRSRLRDKYAEMLPQLYQRAFAWHQENNLPEEALHYALRGCDCLPEMAGRAAEIIEAIGERVYWQNQAHTVQGWLEALPDDVLQSRPHLRLLHAYVMLDQSKVKLAEAALERLRRHMRAQPRASVQENLVLEGKEKAIRTAIAHHRYLDGALGYKLASRALEILPSHYYYDRFMAAFYGGSALVRLGELTEARHYLGEAQTLSDLTQNRLARLMTLGDLGCLETNAGNLRQARRYFEEAYRLAREIDPRQGSSFSHAVAGLGVLYYEWNQLEEARRYVDEALRIVGRDENDFLARQLQSHAALIQLFCAQGDCQAAGEAWQRLSWTIKAHDPPARILDLLALQKTKMALAAGEIATATAWARQQPADLAASLTYEDEAQLLTLARVYAEEGAFARAILLLERLLDLARKQGRQRSVIRLTTFLARTRHLQGERPAAVDLLREAVRLAEPEGYVRTFLDAGQPVRELLQQLREEGGEGVTPAAYVNRLLVSFEKEACAAPATGTAAQGAAQEAVDTILTARELDVLSLLAQGLPYAEVARRLTISENTLKFHVKNVYGKLRAKNRLQAVLAAQESGIL